MPHASFLKPGHSALMRRSFGSRSAPVFQRAHTPFKLSEVTRRSQIRVIAVLFRAL
jgi:hypothetical protein